MNKKHWYQSKLVWAGIVETVIGVLQILDSYNGDFTSLLTNQGSVHFILGVFFVVSRIWFTKTTITGFEDSYKKESQQSE